MKLGLISSTLWGSKATINKEFYFLGNLIFLCLGLTLLTLYNEVDIDEAGLKIRVFIFFWRFVPWEDVIRITITPIVGANNPTQWRFIQVRKLTIFHHIISLSYKTGSNPIVIINKHIRNYDELFEVIERRLSLRPLN